MLGEDQQFAGYTVVRFLGAGGMGEVYVARHPRLPRRRDALKLLGRGISADRNFRERFLREADLASTLSHQHIVSVYDRGEDQGQLWIAMDYIDGEDAAQLLRRRFPAGMPAELAAAIVTAVGSALDYAHSQGLLHRDVKPANILLSNPEDPAQRRILLTDFGIARALDDVSDLTPTNTTLGTVAYSAPEQLMGQELDGRADQYALAATAFHLLTGTTMFPQSNAAAVIGHHLGAEPPPVAAARPELSGLDPVLRAALAKNPQDRFLSCTDFARAFAEQAVAGTIPPAAPTAPGLWVDGRAAAPQPAKSNDRSSKSGTRHPTYVEANRKAYRAILEEKRAAEKAAGGGPAAPTAPGPWVGEPADTRSSGGTRGTRRPINNREFYQAILKEKRAAEKAAAGRRPAAAKWAAAVAVAAAAAGVTVLGARALSHSDGAQPANSSSAPAPVSAPPSSQSPPAPAPPITTRPPAPPRVSPTGIVDSALLTPDELSGLLGGVPVTTDPAGGVVAPALKMTASSYGPTDHASQVTPPTCVGVVFTADHGVYGDSSVEKMKTESFAPASYGPNYYGPSRLEQTVAVFPSAADAQNMLAGQQRRWEACRNPLHPPYPEQLDIDVGVTLGYEQGRDFTLGKIQENTEIMTISMASNDGLNGPDACQQAMGIRNNVIVEARTCKAPSLAISPMIDPDPSWAIPDAQRLVAAMLNKVS